MSIILTLLLGGVWAGAADRVGASEASGEVNSVLAAVNGTPVTLADVLPLTREREYQAYATFSGEQLADAIRRIRRATVDELINRQLIVSDFKSKNLKLPAGEVESGLDRIAEQFGCRGRAEFLRKLRQNKMSLETLRREVEENLMVQLMMVREFQIEDEPTPQEQFEYFQRHQKEFATPEQVELAMLKIDNDEAASAKIAEISAALQRPTADFGALVRRFSTGPERDKAGVIGRIECRMLRPEFAAALKDIKELAVYGPVKTSDGIYWLKIQKYIPSRKPDFREQGRKIKNSLEKERRRNLKRSYVEKLRKQAVIRYFFDAKD